KAPATPERPGARHTERRFRMPSQRTTPAPRKREQERDYRQPPPQLRKRGHVCVVDGFGTRVAVERGHLLIQEGAGRDRHKRRYSRTDLKLARVVVLGSAGSLSLAAIRWLADVGVPLIHIDREGRLLVTATPELSHAQLRRAQALALFNASGLEIARCLLREKLAGQQRVLDSLPASPAAQDEFTSAI